MAIICPTITAYNEEEYGRQIDKVISFTKRLHIDLMDGQFAPSKSPSIDKIWLPDNIPSDIHLMYQKPMDYIEQLANLRPNMVIVHLEADLDHRQFANFLKADNIKVGLALLQSSTVDSAAEILAFFDQVLIFSGQLGYHGGEVDISLTNKIDEIRAINKTIEIAWDGGINAENAALLVDAGVSVLNVGSFIQDSNNPQDAYDKLNLSLKK